MTSESRDKNSMDTTAFDVFISYSSKDKQIADAVKHGLHSAGIRCWMAPDDIQPGRDWASDVTDAIEACPVMALIWTKASMSSAEVPKELGLAMSSGTIVIPFRLEDIQPEGSFKYHLTGRHWLDVYDKSLCEAVRQLTELVRINIPALSQKAKPFIEEERVNFTAERQHEYFETVKAEEDTNEPINTPKDQALMESNTAEPLMIAEEDNSLDNHPLTFEQNPKNALYDFEESQHSVVDINSRTGANPFHLLATALRSLSFNKLATIDAMTGEKVEWQLFSDAPDLQSIEKAIPSILGSVPLRLDGLLAICVEGKVNNAWHGIAITDAGINFTIGIHPRWEETSIGQSLRGKPMQIAWIDISSLSINSNLVFLNDQYPLCTLWEVDKIDASIQKLLTNKTPDELSFCRSIAELCDEIGLDPVKDKDMLESLKLEQSIWVQIIECCLNFASKRKK